MAVTPRSPRKKSAPARRPARAAFDADLFLDNPAMSRHVVDFARGERIFSQGDPGDSVYYIRKGAVKLSVVSKQGREAVVAILEPGDFFGEGCLAAQPLRLSSATTVTAASVLRLVMSSAGGVIGPRRYQRLDHLVSRSRCAAWTAIVVAGQPQSRGNQRTGLGGVHRRLSVSVQAQ